jgi:arabinogalactan endo-1,4-beta-galactosidase
MYKNSGSVFLKIISSTAGKMPGRRILLLFFWIIGICGIIAQTDSGFIAGADLSFIPQVEDNGGVYYSNGKAVDPVKLFWDNGFNYIRLRLWHTPADKYCGLDSTLKLAVRAKAAGMKILLDFHYSDTWADPSWQEKPAAWKNLTYNELQDSLYSYTYSVIKAFDSVGVLPVIVQTGNEISPGFLWRDGRVGGAYDTQEQWSKFTGLLKRAIRAVKDASSDSIKIMIHLDRGGNNTTSRWFFDNLAKYNVDYDIIGQSYYPWWHGDFNMLKYNLSDLSLRYGKEIIVAETAYPWTYEWADSAHNLVGDGDSQPTGHAISEEGQYSYLVDLTRLLRKIPGGKVTGVFYWAPEWISVPSFGSSWENCTMFDFHGNSLKSIKAFSDALKDTTVSVENNDSYNDRDISFSVTQNYPNPFNGSTIISFTLVKDCNVQVLVYDITGRKTREVLNKFMNTGSHSVLWDSLDDSGKEAASGIYIIKIITPFVSKEIKSVLIK